MLEKDVRKRKLKFSPASLPLLQQHPGSLKKKELIHSAVCKEL